MKTIAEIADRCGAYLCQKTENEAELKTVTYGLEVFLVFAIDLIMIFFSGFIFGVLYQTMMVMFSLLLVRLFIGGSHLSGFLRCLIFSDLLIIGTIVIFKYYFVVKFSAIVVISVGLISIYFINRYAPVVVEWKVFSEQKIWQMRLIASGLVILWSIVYLLWQKEWTKYFLLGTYLAVLNVTPLMRALIKYIEELTNPIRKEVN